MNTLTLPKRLWRLWRSLFHSNREQADQPWKPTSFGDFPPDEDSLEALEQARTGKGLKTYKSVDDLFADLDRD